ncbi:MAG: class I SAM-dependent methyltransferase [Desertimonas sp.]
MTTTNPSIDLRRWPALAPVPRRGYRTVAARWLLRRAAGLAGVTIVMPDGRRVGSSDPGAPVMEIRTTAFLDRVARDFTMGFGEGYMAGEWTTGADTDLGDLVTAFARHLDALIPAPIRGLRRRFEPPRPADQRNTRGGARDNIHQHYDLSNDMFATFLDDTMTYSSAWFADDAGHDHTTPDLAAAQRAKIDRLLDETGVGAGTRLLEIGTGWGELSIRAAQRGAQVHTITLSAEQLALARQRAVAAGVGDRIRMELRDYRDLDDRYDAVVSVEMIEAVGEEYLPDYFTALARALEPGGRIGLQAITMPHQRMLDTRDQQTWVLRYIFPGGFLPSPELIREHARVAGLAVDGTPFGLAPDYACTLHEWRDRFTKAAGVIGELGFDGPFQRMWVLYLAQSEAGFRADAIDVAQWILRHEH